MHTESSTLELSAWDFELRFQYASLVVRTFPQLWQQWPLSSAGDGLNRCAWRVATHTTAGVCKSVNCKLQTIGPTDRTPL